MHMNTPTVEQLTATCSRAQARCLLPYDHHAVTIAGRRGVLLTYPWMAAPLETQPEPFCERVAMRYAELHPPAPAAVQAVIDQLHFQPK